MSYYWSKINSYNPLRYSSQCRYHNGVKRYNSINTSCNTSNISHGTIVSSRFHFRRQTGGIHKAPLDFRKLFQKNIEKQQASGIKAGNSHLSISKTATKRSLNQPTYGFSSTFSKFKYLRKSLVSKRSKSKTLLKGTKSTNPFVYQKSALKTTVTLIHPYRLCVKRAININRRFVRQICPDYVKTGFCESGDICPLRHDPKYLRICSKFLQNACLLGENKCPLAHIMDPCRIPQCAYFAKGACSRCCCNFLHIKYPEGTPFCPDFLVGRCEKWSTCKKRHIWRGELDSCKIEISASASVVEANKNLAKKSAQLGSLRETKIIPDYIPFYVSDD